MSRKVDSLELLYSHLGTAHGTLQLVAEPSGPALVTAHMATVGSVRLVERIAADGALGDETLLCFLLECVCLLSVRIAVEVNDSRGRSGL